MRKKHLALTLGLIFFSVGLAIPFWPFMLLGILACALMYPVLSVLFGALADIVLGAPTGIFHYLYFPFTLLGLTAALLSLFASSRLRSRKMY
jgi:hypothetical protein